MNEKVYTIDEIKEIILPILLKYNAQSAILFGSYARNEADKESDIDVMVVGGNDFEPTDIFCIADDIFTSMKKPVDVYEQREIDNSSLFYKNIMREGVTLR